MPRVRFHSADGTVEAEVPIGKSLLEASQIAGAPEGSACGGVCACSTCHVHVKQGADLLSAAEDEEEDILDKAFDVVSSSRLGCQSRIERDGFIEVDITRESYETWYNEHPRERHARDERLKAAANETKPGTLG